MPTRETYLLHLYRSRSVGGWQWAARLDRLVDGESHRFSDPEVLLADEPTGNLDSVSGAQVMAILDGLHDAGRTVILVTHETNTAEFADRIIRLRDGVIESDAPVNNPRHSKNEFFK